MYSVDSLKFHVSVFRLCGFWPHENGSWLYDCWSMIFSVVVAIGFPLSQLVCVLFVDSGEKVIEHLILSSTVVMVSVKGFNVMVQKRILIQLFNILTTMDENVVIEKSKYRKILENSARNCRLLTYTFLGSYVVSWSILALQIVFSSVENRGWSSTSLYPSAYLRQPSVYWGVLIFQAAANFIIILLAAAVDTYAAILMDILGAHIEVLKIQLQEFAVGRNDSNDFQSLFRFCEKYESILR